MAQTFRARYQGDESVDYSLDAAKGRVAARSGKFLKWVKAPDGPAHYGFVGTVPAAGQPQSGWAAEVLTSNHKEF